MQVILSSYKIVLLRLYNLICKFFDYIFLPFGQTEKLLNSIVCSYFKRLFCSCGTKADVKFYSSVRIPKVSGCKYKMERENTTAA
jgi:hypothetical protein